MMSRPGTGTRLPLCATQFSLAVCHAGILKYPPNFIRRLSPVPWMSNTALPPHMGGCVDWHIGCVPPPHSSENSSLVPSLLNVAECQNANAGSATSSNRFGFVTLRVSSNRPVSYTHLRAHETPEHL